jgi:outer membrane receptor protein involved in Fe transport
VRSFNNKRVVKALLLAGGASTFAIAVPAMAQDDGAEEEDRIVVTGSRIQRQDFEANSPFVTIDEGFLDSSSTAAIESNLNRLPQFVPAKTPTQGGDIQPTATNTPGAATVSLRGIGANRNLVLIDGRRGTPGNASGVVDISTIPSAAIERVEVISGGASATYGADAVAGVTNFILKKDFQGLELDAQAGITQEGDGFEYQLSGIMGADFDDGRGNISLAMSMNTREANYQRDRSWYRDLWADPNIGGTQFFIPAPGFSSAGNLPNYSTVFPNAPANANATVYFTPEGRAFTIGANGTTSNFGTGSAPLDDPAYKKSINGAIGTNNTNLYLILPLTRYNAFARGNYEINDWIGVFGQAMFSHVETYTRNEPGPAVNGWTVNIDPTRIDLNDLPADMRTLLNSRANPNGVFTMQALLFDDRETFTDVTTYNLTAGLEGSIPGTSFAWEAFVNHGISSTYAKQTGIYSLSRFQAVVGSPNFGEGFYQKGNQGPPNFGFGASDASCTTGLNLYNPPAGGFSEDCLEAIRADLKNRGQVTQTIAEANISGGLFDLPAGEVGMALGASFREVQYEFDNDTLTTQGRSFQDQALGIYPSGNVDADFDVHELYGELLIPVLEGIPGIQEFNLELGGRMSDYSTTGTSYTYKILGDWQVTDWLRFRGGYNLAERAPNIGELYLSAQQTFGVNTAGDPCSLANPLSFSANQPGDQYAGGNANGARVEAVCRIQMQQAGPNAEDYYLGVQGSGTFGFAFPTTVGNENLIPETAKTWTAGMVINSPFDGGALERLRLSVDWFSIHVTDAIGEQTVGVALQQCYDPALNPAWSGSDLDVANSQFCQNVPRNATGNLGNVFRTYVNNGEFKLQGIDVQLDWGMDVGPGTLNLNVLANYQIDFKSSALAAVIPLIDYVGTQGTGENGLNQGVYEYRILANLGYAVGPATVSLQWQHLPSIEDASEATFGVPTPTTGFPSYNMFNLNSTYSLNDSVNLRFGVDNLFNKKPPLGNVNTAADPALGQLSGGSFNSLFYDTNGRRFYLGANFQF